MGNAPAVVSLSNESIILPKYGRVGSVDYMSLGGFEAVAAGFGLTNYTSSNRLKFADTVNSPSGYTKLFSTLRECISRNLFSHKMW